MKRNQLNSPKPLDINGQRIGFKKLNNYVDWGSLESKVGFFNFDMGLNEFRSYISLLFLNINYDLKLDELFTDIKNRKTNPIGKQYYDFALHTPFIEELDLEKLREMKIYLTDNDLIKYFKSNQELLIRKKSENVSFGSTHNVINTNRFKSVI